MSFESSPGDHETPPDQLIRINRICDRFEAAWRAGRRPAAEDHLGDAVGPERSALLRELVATELECRRAIGERPALAEYRARFPGDEDAPAIEAAFVRTGIPPTPPASSPDAGRNLLFGLLALQNDFIGRDDLLAAFNAWVADKSRQLGAILLERGAIDAPRHALLEALVGEHLKRHGGDPEQSLASLTMGDSTRDSLKKVDDPDVEASLARVGSSATASNDCTTLYAVGTSTDGGRRFRVLRPHAQGGLGAVFVAMDSELNREVALKEILDRHADDPVSRQRFLVEAEITGGLEHPGIVPVYGLGSYGDGRPYYAMRFIQGDSLKEAIASFHADPALKADPGARSLALSKLLRRFLDVCNAIGYAHSRGVLHRDIKPGNVIVGKYGETLVVDWGLAKSTGRSDSDERTLRPSSASGSAETLPGSAMGTPAYMSPEQAAGDLDRIGPRSDVYGLGATLYSLLTGRAPASSGDVMAVLHAVREGKIPPPRSHDPTIDRSLEAVCLKAMAKAPEDRYPTPRALAEDVERWLADESVTAYREPFSKRARRWAKRHRTAATAAAVALVAGVIGLSALAAVQDRANRKLQDEQTRTRIALAAETKAKGETEVALAQKGQALLESEESRKRSAAVLKFLQDDVLAAARPEGQDGGLGVAATIRQAVDAAEPKIAERFKDQPLVEADIRDTLGLTYWYLGEALLAIKQHGLSFEVNRTNLGPDHPDTLISCNNLAVAYHDAGRVGEAIRLNEETLRRREAKLGPDHPDTLISRSNLATDYRAAGRANDAIRLHEETLRRREAKLGSDHPVTLQSRNNLAVAYHAAGRVGEAIRLNEETLRLRETKLGGDHPNTLESRNNLATDYLAAGRVGEAIPMLEETLRLCEAKLGPDHPVTLQNRNDLAVVYHAAGRVSEAIRLLEETLRRREAKLGPDHPNTLESRSNLAVAYLNAGRSDEAIRLHEEALRLREANLGPGHSDTFNSRNNLAAAFQAAGRSDDAIRLFEETLRLITVKLGPDHPNTLKVRSNLAFVYHNAGRLGEAIRMDEETLRLREANLGPDHPDTLESRNNLAEAYLNAGRSGDAIRIHEETLRLMTVRMGPDHPSTFTSRNNLAKAYESIGRWADAEGPRRETLTRRRKIIPPQARLLSGDLASLGSNLLKQAKWSEAEPVLRECLTIREKAMPDDWSRFNAMSLLGESLLGQGQYAEAESPVVQGYEGIKSREAKIPAPNKIRLSEAAGRVVRLYEAWGKPRLAASWKARLGLAELPANVFAR